MSKRYKARLVVKGFQKLCEIEYIVVKMPTIKKFLSIIVVEDLHLEQLDMKTIFLHGDLE